MNTVLEILHEKIISNPIKNLHWCHSMDLLAVITKTNKILVFVEVFLFKFNKALQN